MVGAPLKILISFKSFGYQLLHFLAQIGWFENFDAIAIGEQLTKEIVCWADIE